MVLLNRAMCLSAALVVLCVHTATSYKAYGSSDPYSAPSYGSSSDTGAGNGYGSYGNYYPGDLYNYGGYVSPNDGRAPTDSADNPIQPLPKGDRLYPSYGLYSDGPVGKPFPQSGYEPYPADTPYYSSGSTYPAPDYKPYSPSGPTYPSPEDKTYSPSGPAYPVPYDNTYPSSGSYFPAPEPYSPKSSKYEDPKSQVDYKPDPYIQVEPYGATPVDPKTGPYPRPGNFPKDSYTDNGYPTKQVQPPRSYRPVPAKPSLPSSLCDNCRFKNGVGYNPFPKSCQDYVTCQKYDGYKLLPTKMSCPYNLFWSQKLLTCVRPKNIECPYDACAKSKGGKTAAVRGNCAAYHVCGGYGRTSAIYCCAYGYRYQANYGYNKPGYKPCVEDHTCSDTCAPQKTPIRKERCRLFPVRGLVTKYQELVHGKYVLRWCAPGTAFVHKDCGCTARVKVQRKPGCNAEVFIDFKRGIRDVSGNFVSVGNEWDRVKSVKAAGAKDGFAGKFYNAQLILWRFANAPLGPPLKIAFAFLEKDYKKGGYGGKNEVLVSNGDCGKPASVSVTFDRATHTVTALVDTKSTYGKNYKPAHVSVSYVPGEYKNVVYVYDGKYLTLSVNGKSKSVAAHGDVQVRQCALSLGGVKGGTAFYGLIDDFKLFLCTPKPVSYYPKGPYPAPYDANRGTYPKGDNVYPGGPGPYPAGKNEYPAGTSYYPGGKNDYPSAPGSYLAGKNEYPTGPGYYPAGKNDYPAGPDSYPAGKNEYPAGPGYYPAGKNDYPAGPGSYPAGKNEYPAGPGYYPAGKNDYPAGPGSNPAGKNEYPAGPGYYSAGKNDYPAGPGSNPAGKNEYPAGPGYYSAGKNDNKPTAY